MPSSPVDRTRTATPDLQILDRWEDTTAWLIEHTAKWPKNHRFTFAQRAQNLALEVLDLLVEARYVPGERSRLLQLVNRDLERIRHLLRLAERLRIMPSRGFESAMRQVDEVGRMAYGWRTGARRIAPGEVAVAGTSGPPSGPRDGAHRETPTEVGG